MKLGKGTILFLKLSHKSLIFYFLDKFLVSRMVNNEIFDDWNWWGNWGDSSVFD